MTRRPTSNQVVNARREKRKGRAESAQIETDGYTAEPPEQLLGPDDDLAEELAEEYLISATSGEQAAEDIRNEETPEDNGGPFVETTLAQEMDYDDDEPEDSEAEPFPTATRSEEEEEDE